ncbi:MAG: alpha/beta fold hydrolase [Synechococcales bacterium]|nr:alpha/beta fold hydrolase [Synechococcales bacterium]
MNLSGYTCQGEVLHLVIGMMQHLEDQQLYPQSSSDQAIADALPAPLPIAAPELSNPKISVVDLSPSEPSSSEPSPSEPSTAEASLNHSVEAISGSRMMGDRHFYDWQWQGQAIRGVYEVMGQGKPILLLPAFSTISSREEMRRLAELLSQQYQTYLLDWVGFGESDRPALAYEPKLYRAFLRSFVSETFQEPIVVIAAGHTAGYVMALAQDDPKPWSWVVLSAPTWRGPLPTMMGDDKRKTYHLLQKLINLPVLGQLLYWLNSTRWVLRWMIKRHVYADRSHITRNLVREKWKITQEPGARFAPAAFVTGRLDPVRSTQEWLNFFQPLPLPVLMVIGEQMPPRSRAEAEVAAHFSGVQVLRLPGTLGLHEEYAEQFFQGISPFLGKYLSDRKKQ